MSDSNNTNRINISLPAATERLWREQAEEDGSESLSEWIRDCGNANLSSERQRQNVKPRPRGRQKK